MFILSFVNDSHGIAFSILRKLISIDKLQTYYNIEYSYAYTDNSIYNFINSTFSYFF